MADIGEKLGGDDLNFSIDQPLRIIIGGPPHSGKSTLMNLLEDRFQYYQIPVQLLDLDLSAPTPLKTGFTQQREKRKWTSTLAEEAKSMFEQAEGVQVVLGDSVGLISEINEIISQPADVAILLVSGGHGDYDDTYRKVVRKWKEYYEDIRKPLLVVLRSTMNPADESMFDPQDNYGVVVGMDRDAYEANVISGHYRYDGLYPTNACLEGVVFEIAQSFDLKVRSATDPEHLAILNQKWPDLKDKKTWTPPADSMLGGIERAYFEERGRVPADQRAESFSADGWDSYTVSYREEEDDPHFEVDDDYDDLNEAMSAYQHFINTGMNSVMIAGYTLNEKGDYEEDSKPVAEYSKDAYDNRPQGYSAEYYTKYYLPNRLVPEVGDEAMFEGGEIRITAMERNPDVIFYTYLDEDGKSDGFIHTRDKAKFVDRWTPFPMEKDTVILSNYGDKDDLSFKEWADQEMMTHGKKESFDEWLNDELSHHGDNMSLQDWGQHELDSHYERYGAEGMTSFDVINIEYSNGEDYDLPDTMSVLVEENDVSATEDRIREKVESYISHNFGEGVKVVDFTAFYAGTTDPLRGNYEDYAAEGDPKVRRLKTIAKWINENHGDTHFADMRDTQYGYYNGFNQYITKDGKKLVVYELTPKGKYYRREVFSHNPLEPYRNNKEVERWVKDTFTSPVTLRYDTPFFYGNAEDYGPTNPQYNCAVCGHEWSDNDGMPCRCDEDYAAEEKIHSQLMIGSLIGLGAGLWAVNRFKESREEK